MFNPLTLEWNFNSAILWIDFALAIVLILFFCYIYTHLFDRKTALIISTAGGFLSLVSWFFGLTVVFNFSLVILAALLGAALVLKQNEIADLLKLSLTKRKRQDTEKVYDRHAVCQQIAIAVENLSRTKTGALITFEKQDSLDDVVKTGTIINSPIVPELITTIFYTGTRLHDGAVVIRRDCILAASVYYTPTTKPLTGKFGSRHRAAIGISENTDAVTVVVSEETGRISITHRGELIPVQQDNFLRTLEDYIFMEEKEDIE